MRAHHLLGLAFSGTPSTSLPINSEAYCVNFKYSVLLSCNTGSLIRTAKTECMQHYKCLLISFTFLMQKEATRYILSQWVWFSMSIRNFIDSGQNSANPVQDDRRIACPAITRSSCVFYASEYRVSRL